MDGPGFDLFMAPLERALIAELRAEFVARARGRVLELGAGSGANLVHYRPGLVTSLVVSDREPGRRLGDRAARLAAGGAFPLECRAVDALALPFPDASFDTVVATLLFCGLEEPAKTLRGIARVLAPGGSFLFIEHVASKRKSLAALMRGLSPAWSGLAGGCRLDRDTEGEIRAAGFEIRDLRSRAAGIFIAGEAGRPD